ncbi:MAG: copper resistance CopC family protein, partial [Comamonas sp.]
MKRAPAAPDARSLRAWPASLLLLAALLALMLASPRARAHASLVQSEPASASVLSQAPGALTLRFDEDVTPTRIEIVEADGRKVAPRDVHAGGTTLTVQLPTLGGGVHAVSWHVISADGHPVAGVVTFSVGTAAVRP